MGGDSAAHARTSVAAPHAHANRRSAIARIGVLAVLIALVWFGTLGVRPLYKADESRYGEIPREMLVRGDLVTPRLNDFRYFEKPPLQYWATAGFYKVFGVDDYTARLWTGLTGFLGLCATFYFARRLFGGQTGEYSAMLLLASPMYVACAQFNTLDMGLAFFMSTAVLAFSCAQAERSRRLMLLFWVFAALAVLSKGLVGIVLPLAAIAAYSVVRRDGGLIARLRLFSGGALFLLIAAPWFVAVSAANPEFAHFFFVQEHFQRFTSTIHSRYGPIWYFVPVLALSILPWLMPMAGAIRELIRRPANGPFDPRLFLGIWSATVFAVFSASSSKLPAYILPLLPALAVLAGDWLARAGSARLLALQYGTTFLVMGGGIAASLYYFAAHKPDPGMSLHDYLPWIAAAVTVLAAGTAAGIRLALSGRRKASVCSASIAMFVAMQLALSGHGVLADRYSIDSLVRDNGISIPEDVPVFALEGYDHTLPWVLRRPVIMVNVADELGPAIAWEPDKFIPDLGEFERRWQAAHSAYAVILAKDYERIHTRIRVPMQTVGRGPRYVLVRKP